MKMYSVSQVRERLAEALDEAEQGLAVVIERRGVRYRLTVEEPDAKSKRAGRRKREPLIEVLDPAVAEGQWTWDWEPGSSTNPGSLTFRDTRPKR